jgi:AcrR family transcriptional regulator
MGLRFSRTDWLELGTRLLREHGPGALTIESLTATAKKTRGSFYHHFADRDVFLSELVSDWGRRVLHERAEAVASPDRPDDLRAFLRAEPLGWDHGFERSLRQLAVVEPVVRQGVEAVDRVRVETLAALIAVLRPGVEDPRSEAFVQYAVAVGGQWLLDDADDPRLPGFREAASRLFGLQ